MLDSGVSRLVVVPDKPAGPVVVVAVEPVLLAGAEWLEPVELELMLYVVPEHNISSRQHTKPQL
jgi:hypothetical protein